MSKGEKKDKETLQILLLKKQIIVKFDSNLLRKFILTVLIKLEYIINFINLTENSNKIYIFLNGRFITIQI